MENLSVLKSAWLHDYCGSSASALQSSVAVDSRACPICFALMKPPHLAPIILTPCGHTFCAKCIAVHTAVQRKKARLQGGGAVWAPPCPHCKERVVAQSVNITLQNIIMERLAIEESVRQGEMESRYPKMPWRGHLLYAELTAAAATATTTASAARLKKGDWTCLSKDKVVGVHGRASSKPLCCQSLQNALQETRDRQERLETDLSAAEEELGLLESREKELKQILQKASSEHLLVQSKLEDTKSRKGLLHQAHAETLGKAKLIQASMVASMGAEAVEWNGGRGYYLTTRAAAP